MAWLALILSLQRAGPFAGVPGPSCGAFVDPAYGPAIARARAQAQALMAERGIPGLSVAVSVDGRRVWAEGFGWADVERRVAACPETQFRIASLSKLVTVAAMARLVEQGRLDLDAPVQRYVPSFPEKGHVITPRQLASHLSGIRSYRDDMESINAKSYSSVLESLEKFAADPLVHPPGQAFLYSGYGYVLLSAAVEAAGGSDFLSVVRREVLVPLELSATVENRADRSAPYQATFYDVVTPYSRDGSRVVSPPNDFSSKWASGGFLSTASDLVRFGSAHLPSLETGFLRAETLETLFRPQSGLPPLGGYGLGWMTLSDHQLRRVHFHFGASSGGTAVLAIYPGRRVAVAVLANLGHARYPMGRLLGIAGPFLGQPLVPVLVAVLLVCCAALVRLTRRRA